MSDFPTHWELSTFGEVSEYVQRGKGPKYCERSDFPVVNQKAIRWHGIEEQHLKFVAQEQWSAWSEERFIRKGDILWNSTGTGTVGRACHLDEIQAQKAKVVDSHVTIVRLSQDIDSKFGYYWIRSPEIQAKIDSLSSGSTNQVELSRNIVLETTFPVPPLAEQTRITQKLDELVAQVDTLKARIDAIPALLKRFRQSVLAAAVSGRLTEEWRERTELRYQTHTNDYPATPLGLVADFQNGFAFKSEWFSNKGDIQVAKIGNVRNGKVDLANSPAFVSNETGFDYQRFMTIEGDLLLSMTGTKYKRDYGYACAAPAGLLVNQRVGKLRPLEGKMESGFLLLCLQSGDFREQFFSGETGQVSQGNVGSEHIKKCLIPTPTIEEQIEITRRVEQLFAFADQLEAKVASAKSRIDHLTQSILAKAFRGELVPQAPNDEPASVLLERIKTQRAAAPKAKRGRKTSA